MTHVSQAQLRLNCTAIALRRILENQWYSTQVKYSQGKLRLYAALK